MKKEKQFSIDYVKGKFLIVKGVDAKPAISPFLVIDLITEKLNNIEKILQNGTYE